MDDDTTQDTYKTQIKGQAYAFRPFTDDELSLIVELKYMHASGDRYLDVVMKQLEEAAGKEQWEELTDRLVARDLGLNDLAGAFKKLFERQLKAREKSAAADGQ